MQKKTPGHSASRQGLISVEFPRQPEVPARSGLLQDRALNLAPGPHVIVQWVQLPQSSHWMASTVIMIQLIVREEQNQLRGNPNLNDFEHNRIYICIWRF